MDPARSELPVADRWRRAGDGAHYAGERFSSRRARERDPRLVTRLLDALPPGAAPIRSVLDVPCGGGRLKPALLRLGGASPPRWTGVDASEEMLAAVPRQGAVGEDLQGDLQRDLQGETVRADAAALPFPDDSFDLVVCCRLLHHLPEAAARRAVLAELVRVSRDLIVASYWDAASFQAWRRRTRGPLRRRRGPETRRAVPWAELREELGGAGASPVRRAHSLRFVSQQAFFLARKRRAT